jgi:RHS repeat-associated protein
MPIPAHYTSFDYDADGQRFRKTHNGTETLYLGDDVEVRGGVFTKYLRVGGQVIAKIEGGTVTWLYTDALGSVRAEEDGAGNIIRREVYLPYGQAVYGVFAGSIGFTGQEQDETGLVFLNARYYDPAVGQFLSPDSMVPTVWPMGLNRYAYAYGNPILYIDPTGHFFVLNIVRVVFGLAEMGIGIASCVYAGCAGGTAVFAFIDGLDNLVSGINGFANGNTNQPGFLQPLGTAICGGDPNCGIALKLGTSVAGMPAGAGLGPALGTIPGFTVSLGEGLAISATMTVVTAGELASAAAGLVSAVTAAGTQSQMSGGRDGQWQALTNKQARELANNMGFSEVKDPPFNSHGELVFKRGNVYITADNTGHSGGVWKMFDSAGNRLGTYNADLTVRIGP